MTVSPSEQVVRRRPRRWLRGMRVLGEHEADRLEERLKEKVARTEGLTHSDSEGGLQLASFEDWLRWRFRQPLERDAWAGPAFGKAATAIGVTTIGAGLASSALASAGGTGTKALVASLGILVGVLAAVNQIWRPSQRSVARYQAAFALRREGWDFLQDRGRYAVIDSGGRLGAFVDEVTRIHRAVESVDEASSPAQSGG